MQFVFIFGMRKANLSDLDDVGSLLWYTALMVTFAIAISTQQSTDLLSAPTRGVREDTAQQQRWQLPFFCGPTSGVSRRLEFVGWVSMERNSSEQLRQVGSLRGKRGFLSQYSGFEADVSAG